MATHLFPLHKAVCIPSLVGLALLASCVGPPTGDDDDDTPPLIPEGGIVISEAMGDTGTGRPEWIELYNPSGSVRDLQGCTLEDGGATAHVFAILTSLPVPAGGFAVVAEDGPLDGANTIPISQFWGETGGLSIDQRDETEELILRCGGTVIDSMPYGSIETARAHSVMLQPDMLSASSNDTADAWCEAPDAYSVWPGDDADYGSPGAGNDCIGILPPGPCSGDLEISELSIAPTTGLSEWFEIRNLTAENVNLNGCIIEEGSGDSWHSQELGEDGDGNLLIEAEGHHLFVKDPPLYPSGPSGDYDYGSLGFNNSGEETLRISCSCGGGEMVEIESVTYDWGNDSRRGHSLSRDPNSGDFCISGAEDEVWSDAEGGLVVGTPGAANTACSSVTSDPQPCPGDLQISEVSIAPTTGLPEWFEIQSLIDTPLSLDGCTIAEGSGDSWNEHTLQATTGNVALASGAHLLLVKDPPVYPEGPAGDYDYSGLSFNNSGEETLRISCGCDGEDPVEIDAITYDWASSDLRGHSLSRDPTSGDLCTSGLEDMVYSDETGGLVAGTPGMANTECSEVVSAPLPCLGEIEISEISVAPTTGLSEWFEIRSLATDTLSLAGCTVEEGSEGSWSSHTFTSGGGRTSIDTGEHLLLVKEPPLHTDGPTGDYDYSGLSFNNSGEETLRVWCACGEGEPAVVDSISYDWGNSSLRGHSLSRDPVSGLLCTSHPDDLFWSGEDGGLVVGTPGAANSTCPEVLPYPTVGDVIFTEVMVRPETGAGEWFELYNLTEEALSLDGCLLAEGTGGTPHEHRISSAFGLTIEPGTTRVMARSEWDVACGSPDYLYSSLSLNNSGEDLQLFCPDETGEDILIDEVVHDGRLAAEGHSLMLQPDYLDAVANDDFEANWCEAPETLWACTDPTTGDTDFGSPGSVPGCLDETEEPPTSDEEL